MDLCKELGIEFLSTPYSFEDVDLLDGLGINAFKVASGQLVELPFLEYLANKNKPLILSTGMATLIEVRMAVDLLKKHGTDFVILQCTTDYPAHIENANILAMQTMAAVFQCPVGYSDHTPDPYSSYAAAALGAVVFEKHFTLDKKSPGPDHSSSLEPDEFKTWIDGIRMVEKSLGSGKKIPSAAEIRNIEGMRRSIVALHPIPEGHKLERSNLVFKRPATGIEPNELENLIGKTAKIPIAADVPIQRKMLK